MFTHKIHSVRPTLDTGEGLTKQSMKKDTDINFIVKKYQRTGLADFVSKRQPEYMEAPDMDFHAALNYINEANDMFADMPSNLRKRFNNDPGEFLDFVHNPDNAEEMAELGLVKRNPEQPTAAVSEATPETSPPGDSAEGASP